MKRFGLESLVIFSLLLAIPIYGQGFAPKVDYATGATPVSVFASDLDGDGDFDLAVANHGSSTVSVLKNNGDGTFAAKVDYATGTNPQSVFAADLDGDTDFDLAVANFSSNTVSVLKNNGDGTFAATVDYATENSPQSVFAADLDGDTDFDLAVANLNSHTVSVLKNNGDGTFALKVDYATGTNPGSVFASDLDGDGDFDLAVANLNSHTVSVLKNNGDGTFAAKVDYATGTNPFSVFASDLDGDGDFDLAVANYTSNTVSVLKNNGDGTFAAKVDYGTGTNPRLLFASDLDGDTNNDLAVANFGSNTVSVLINLTPSPRPRIVSITDIANDQGKQVRIRWRTTAPGDTVVKKYDIFRRIDEFAASAAFLLLPDWEQVATFSAYGDTVYNGIVPTLVDSTVSGGLKWSVFFIRAATNSPVFFFDSPIDSGYSVDNLVPSAPANLQATGTAVIASLHWSPVSDGDFDFYYVYRDTLSGFSPSPSKRVIATSDTLATDSLSNPNKAYYYLVTAVDFSGNESPASNQAQLCTGKAGDANASGTYTLGDVISIVNYIFNKPGCAPQPQCWLSSLLCRGDWNGSGTVSLSDVIQAVNYIFNKPNGPWNALPVGVCCLL